MARCVSRCVLSFAGTHDTGMPPFMFSPIIRVNPTAPIVRVHEVPQPVRVHSAGGVGMKWEVNWM